MYDYKGRNYSKVEGKDLAALKAELSVVFERYHEFQQCGFDNMVWLFATDDFYNLHFVAKRFLLLRDNVVV